MDLALVEAARSGDEEAFASIARATLTGCSSSRIGSCVTSGRAEDAVQQTLVTPLAGACPGLRDAEQLRGVDPSDPGHACYAEASGRRSGPPTVVCLPVDGPRRATRPKTSSPATRSTGGSVGCRRSNAPRSCSPLPRLVGRRDRREPRRPGADGQVEAPLRDIHPPGGTRSRCPNDQPPHPWSGWHDRQRIRPGRPRLARRRPDPDVRPCRAVRPRADPHDSTAPCPEADVEDDTGEHLRPRGRRPRSS
jgi:hypothetical protein